MHAAEYGQHVNMCVELFIIYLPGPVENVIFEIVPGLHFPPVHSLQLCGGERCPECGCAAVNHLNVRVSPQGHGQVETTLQQGVVERGNMAFAAQVGPAKVCKSAAGLFKGVALSMDTY